MKTATLRIFILFIFLGISTQYSFGTSYQWVGSTSTNWATSTNWSPSGVPDSADNVTISSGTYNLLLDQNRRVTNLTLSNKTVDLNSYSLTVYGTATMTSGTVTNGTFYARGTLAAFNGTLMDCPVDAICGYIRLSGSTFNETADFTDTGTATGTGTGGCTFNDNVTITHGGTLTYFTLANTTGDTFNGNVTFTNNSNRELYVATNGTTQFKGNIILNSTSTGGISFGNGTGSSTLDTGKTITIGNSGFAADFLTLKNFTQSGSTSQTLTLTGTAAVNMSSTTFNGNLTVSAPGFLLKNSTFNGTGSFTKTGTGNHQSDGGNVFNGAVTLTNNGTSGRIRMATLTADTYNSDATFNSTGQDVQIAYLGNNHFAGNITINSNKVVFNTSTGKVTFTGTNNQTLNGSYNYPFKKLAIDKTSGTVTANATLSVDDSLIFIQGKLITTSTNLLTMKHGSTATGASNNSFVSGPVKKVGNSSFIFPIGKDTLIRSVAISSPSNSTDAFTAEYFDSAQSFGSTMDSTLRFLSTCNYWNVTRTTGSSNVYLSFLYNTLFCDGRPIKPAHIAHWNGSSWSDKGLATTDGDFKKTSAASTVYGIFLMSYPVGLPYENDMNDGCYIATTSSPTSSCSCNSQAFDDKYGRVSFYIPEPTDPIKRIKVYFNIFQDDNGDCNFDQSNTADIVRLNTIVDYINNNFLSNLEPYQYLSNGNSVILPNLASQPPTITDSRIRIEVEYVFFQNTTLSTSSTVSALQSYVLAIHPDHDDGLNVMLTNSSYGAGGLVNTLPAPCNITDMISVLTFRAYSSNLYPYCTSYVVGDFWRAGHLAHEIGHALGLEHTYISGSGGGNANCNSLLPDYLWDIFGNPNTPGGSTGSFCPWTGGATNNIMGGDAGGNNHISPLQLGTMHRALSMAYPRKWVICDDFTGHHPIEVDAAEDWDFDLKWYGDIKIAPTGSVNLTCSLQMPMNSRILVERDGALAVDGGVVYGDCDFWKGIEVWGNRNESQFPVNSHVQGSAYIINSSEIWDMEDGIYTYKDLGSGGIDWDYTGGLVVAANSSFYNNKRAIQLMSYTNFVPGFPNKFRFNRSSIYGCLFETNYSLKYPYEFPQNFITLNDVDLFPIYDNTFQNTLGVGYYNEWERGNGIKAIDCRLNVYNSTFNNLWYGIKIDNTLQFHPAMIDRNNFNDCDISVRFSNMNHGIISRCTTNVADRWSITGPGGSTYFGRTRGFELENCPNYFVEDNRILAVSTDPENADYGIIAKDNGALANQIYRNYFYGFQFSGITAQGINGDFMIDEGLRILCNKFEDDILRDIYVTSGSIVATTQGFCNGTDPNTPARNEFITNICTSGGVQFDNSSVGPLVLYGHNDSPTEYLLDCDINVIANPCIGVTYDSGDCPSAFSTSPNHWRSLIASAETDIANYNRQFDGELTSWLLDSLNQGIFNAAMKDSLIKYSPWISDIVLNTIIKNSENFDFNYMKEVLDSNSRLPQVVWNNLNSINTDVSALLIDTLEYAQGRTNESLGYRNLLSMVRSERENYLTNLSNLFLTDSTFEEGGIDSVLLYYVNDNSFEHLSMKFSLHLKKGNYSESDSILTIMKEMDYDDAYCELLNLTLVYMAEQGNIYAMTEDSELIEFLQTLATTDTRAGIYAQNILGKVLDEYYPMNILYPEEESRLMKPETNNFKKNVVGDYILYPNPASESFVISKKDDSFISKCSVKLVDVSFREIQSFNIYEERNKIVFNIPNLENGVYFVVITEDSGKVSNYKLLISN